MEDVRTSIRVNGEDASRIHASAIADKRAWTTQLVVLALEAIDRRWCDLKGLKYVPGRQSPAPYTVGHEKED